MLKYALKRLLEAIPVIIIVVTVTFFMMRLAPGGPFDSDKQASAETIAAINAHYGLDKPLWQQYLSYWGNLLQGDLGPSMTLFPSRSVQEVILEGFPETTELGLYAITFALLLGILSGVTASLKKNTLLDYIPMSFSMFGICVPSFLLGPTLVLVFAIWNNWLPVSGWSSWDSKILPSITLGASYAAFVARLSRGGMLEILSQDFIRTARAKGVPEHLVIIKHALKGGLFPVISFLGPAIAGLLAGSFVVETIFQIPGMGSYYVKAAFARDYTMVMGTTTILATFIILFNMLSDVLVIWLNPKLSFEKARS